MKSLSSHGTASLRVLVFGILRIPNSSSSIKKWGVIRIKVVILLTTLVNHGIWWHAAKLHYQLKLLLLIVSWEYRLTSIKLCQNTPKTPNVNLLRVLYPENNFRGPVKSRLHISIDLLIPEASRSKVNNLQVPAHRIYTKNVLGLQITVDDFVLLQEDKALQNLDGVITNLIS